MQFRDLKKQYEVLKDQIDEAVIEVMTDANFISGRQVAELEEQLASYVGVKHCITCANGTDALRLLFQLGAVFCFIGIRESKKWFAGILKGKRNTKYDLLPEADASVFRRSRAEYSDRSGERVSEVEAEIKHPLCFHRGW